MLIGACNLMSYFRFTSFRYVSQLVDENYEDAAAMTAAKDAVTAVVDATNAQSAGKKVRWS